RNDGAENERNGSNHRCPSVRGYCDSPDHHADKTEGSSDCYENSQPASGLDPSGLMSASQVLGQSVFRGLLSSMWFELAIQGTGCVAGVRPSGIPSPGGRRITSRP